MTKTRDDLIKRVKKLLAMTTARGATEEEAMIAAAKAARLMDENNINLAEASEAGTEDFDWSRLSPRERWKAEFYAWVAYHVGQFTGTAATMRRLKAGQQYGEVAYFGRKSDTIFATWLTKALGEFVFSGYQQKLKVWKHAFANAYGKAPSARDIRKFRNGYLFGASKSIRQKLEQLTRERINNMSGDGKALTVGDKWAVAWEKIQKIADPASTRSLTSSDVNMGAYREGIERGSQAQFNVPVSSGEAKPLMIERR
jgi:hypothetical protein